MPIEAPFTEVIDTTTRFQYKAGFLGVGEYGVDAPGVIAVAEGNFFVADDAEVGGVANFVGNAVFHLDALLRLYNNLVLGSGYAGAIDLKLNGAQTVPNFTIGLGISHNTMLVVENPDINFDFAHPAQTNPTIFVHSANQNTTEWISMTHDQTDGEIATGTGDLNLIPAGGQVVFPAGVVGAPGIVFDGDPDTGIYHPGADQISVATAGAQLVAMDAFRVTITTSGSAATPALAINDLNTGLFLPAVNVLGFTTDGTERMRAGSGGIIFIGDGTTTTNANMTIGLTIQQGGNDDEIVSLKSSDVAHGMTAITETDTYFSVMKSEGASGGALLRGFKDADGIPGRAFHIQAALGENADTTKTTAAECICTLTALIKVGAAWGTPNADANLFGFESGSGDMLAIIDAEGTLHLDLGGNGGAAAPSLTFDGDVDTGIYGTANNLHFSASGAVMFSTGYTGAQAGIRLDDARYVNFGNVGDVFIGYDGGNDEWLWNIRGAISRWKDAAIAAFAAGNDLDAEDTYWRFQDGGPDATIIGGNDGGHFNLTMGDGSDAGIASAANGGDGGDYELNPGLEGDGDGVGVHGLRGVIHEWERLGRGGGRRIRGWTDQSDVGALTVVSELTMTLGDNEAWQIIVHAVAMESDGSDRAIYHLESLWYRDGAGATQQGATTSITTIESDAAWDLDFNGNGNDVEIRINGNADTVNWKIIVEWLRVTT